jgi:biotin carboxylase
LPSGLVLFLGMVRRGEFESLQNRGVPLGVLVDTNNKQRLGDVSQFRVVQSFDFSRPLAELIDAVKAIHHQFGVAYLFNVIELYVAQAADVAAALKLPSISPQSARLCLDKTLMRDRFVSRIGREVCARYQHIHSEAELLSFAGEIGYPVFLQPSNVSASMWSTRNNSESALLENYRAMLDEVPRYYARLGQKDKTLSVVAAEYLHGSNISIDCLISREGVVSVTPAVDVLTGQDVGIDDFHHFARIVPTSLSASQEAELARLAVAGVRALDMTTSAAHVEFIGSKLGEIAARPGGNRPRILEMAYGIDCVHAYYQVLTGQPAELQPERQLAAAVVTPFAPRNGRFREFRHLDRIPKLPGYLYHEIRAQPGQAVGLSKSGHRAGLYIELLSPSLAEVRSSVDEIAGWTDLYVLE